MTEQFDNTEGLNDKQEDENSGLHDKSGANNQTSVKAAQKGVSDKKSAFIYLGPNLPGGVLFSGGVYKQIPEHLNSYFDKLPELIDLFVDVREAPHFKTELLRQGSEAFRMYQAVKSMIAKGELNNGSI